MKYCKCGCGNEIKENRIFSKGHYAKLFLPKNVFKKGHKPINGFKKGNIPWNKNKHWSREIKDKISTSKKNKCMGKDHPRYNTLLHVDYFCIDNCGKKVYKKGNRCRECYIKNIMKITAKSPHFMGGLTPLYNLIRNSEEYKIWRTEVFKRDNYTCRECGNNKSGNLNAHHLISFSTILKEFLKLYTQFSIIDDRETIVRLALEYKPFWDLENGKTLCKQCHEKTFNVTLISSIE